VGEEEGEEQFEAMGGREREEEYSG